MSDVAVDNAVLALALHRYMGERHRHGEQVTCLAAQRIGAMAKVIGIRAELGRDALAALGFEVEGHVLRALSDKAMRRALACVREAGCGRRVERLYLLVGSMSVAVVERYKEPPNDTSRVVRKAAVEPVLRRAELPVLPERVPPGVLVLATARSPVLDDVFGLWPVAAEPKLRVALPSWPRSPQQLHLLRTMPGVLAVLVRAGEHAGLPAALALEFARQLWSRRIAGKRSRPAIVVSVSNEAFSIAAGLQPVLHFVTREAWPADGRTGLVDAAVWEWALPSEIHGWYGGPPPQAHLLHAQVNTVLALRRAAREDRLGGSADAQALKAALHARTFDGRFALQHWRRIARLLTTPGPRGAERAPTGGRRG